MYVLTSLGCLGVVEHPEQAVGGLGVCDVSDQFKISHSGDVCIQVYRLSLDLYQCTSLCCGVFLTDHHCLLTTSKHHL